MSSPSVGRGQHWSWRRLGVARDTVRVIGHVLQLGQYQLFLHTVTGILRSGILSPLGDTVLRRENRSVSERQSGLGSVAHQERLAPLHAEVVL